VTKNNSLILEESFPRSLKCLKGTIFNFWVKYVFAPSSFSEIWN